MSDQETKDKHSRRRQQDQSAIAKQVKIAKRFNKYVPENLRDPVNKYSKTHAMDCGNPNCVMCGNRRQFDGETVQEKSFAQTEEWDEE